jgi:hypothetical protein
VYEQEIIPNLRGFTDEVFSFSLLSAFFIQELFTPRALSIYQKSSEHRAVPATKLEDSDHRRKVNIGVVRISIHQKLSIQKRDVQQSLPIHDSLLHVVKISVAALSKAPILVLALNTTQCGVFVHSRSSTTHVVPNSSGILLSQNYTILSSSYPRTEKVEASAFSPWPRRTTNT